MLSEYDRKFTNFPQILQFLTGIPGKPFKFLQNSGIPQYFESGRLWNPAKTEVVLLGNPEMFWYSIRCRRLGGGGGEGVIFSGIAD